MCSIQGFACLQDLSQGCFNRSARLVPLLSIVGYVTDDPIIDSGKPCSATRLLCAKSVRGTYSCQLCIVMCPQVIRLTRVVNFGQPTLHRLFPLAIYMMPLSIPAHVLTRSEFVLCTLCRCQGPSWSGLGGYIQIVVFGFEQCFHRPRSHRHEHSYDF